MPQLNRLFWKFFIIFFIATVISFFLGAGIIWVFANFFKQGIWPPPPMSDSSGMFLVPLISAIISGIIFAFILAGYFSRPIQHLKYALNQASQENFSVRIAPLLGDRRDEIVDLAEDFDEMAKQLQKLTTLRQNFFHDISHELRSPLNRIQTALGIMEKKPEQSADMIRRIKNESGRIDQLLEELITLERIEISSITEEGVSIDLIEIIQSIAEDAAFEAKQKSCTVSTDIEGHFVSRVKGEMIYRAFENIIRNAVKYTQEGTIIEITTVLTDSQLTLTVQDQGGGVPEALLPRIFEPFYRVPTAPVNASGFGLGLAISKRTIEIHGGEIIIKNRSEGGLLVTVKLPMIA